MAPVLKTGRAQALVGSNPTPSANHVAPSYLSQAGVPHEIFGLRPDYGQCTSSESALSTPLVL